MKEELRVWSIGGPDDWVDFEVSRDVDGDVWLRVDNGGDPTDVFMSSADALVLAETLTKVARGE